MTDRQKFWLKAVLFVTFPVWAVPAVFGAAITLVLLLTWETVSALVEPSPPRYGSGKRMP